MMDHSKLSSSLSPVQTLPQDLEASHSGSGADETRDAAFLSDYSLANDESVFGADHLRDLFFLSSESVNEGWLDWVNPNDPDTPGTLSLGLGQLQDPFPTVTPSNDQNLRSDLQAADGASGEPAFSNVTQWLDGSYCPDQPCNYCRRHRLQCLIIQTTSANPNPVTSCSSCVALFRECSLARGEKRQPSRFETLSPVMGHLHGVPELVEDQGDGFEALALLPTSRDESKESKQFVRRGVRILKEWFRDNQDFPYPSEDEKIRLIRETGFSRKRLSTWFANARRRQKQRFDSTMPAQIYRSGSPMPRAILASMTPMERWQASPPEDEGVPSTVIENAIASTGEALVPNIDHLETDEAMFKAFLNLEESSSHLSSSLSSIGSRHSESSTGSASSAWSRHSGESVLPFPFHPPRPRTNRRRPRSRLPSDEGQFQCTFCTQSFKKKHDWTRHEKSVHLQLDSWVCTPDVSQLRPDPAQLDCRFCDHSPVSRDHWDDHEFEVCAQKPMKDRSFSRKDYLWQHLRKFHGCTKLPVDKLDLWRDAGSNVQSRCGFCNATLPTWTARGDHLAQHFKEGYRMHQWVGDWGLDTFVLGALQNAVLPAHRSMMNLEHSISTSR